MITWPNLGLNGEFEECEDALEAINKNFLILDAMSQASVLGQVSALPATGVTGQMQIVSGTGEVFVFTDQWVSLGVQKGWVVYDCDLEEQIVYDGTAWVPLSGSEDDEAEPATTTVTGVAPGPVGSLLYNDGSVWQLADHTDIDKVAIAMLVEVGAGDYKIQTSGPVTISGHGFTEGDYYFGDMATLGGATATKPVAGEIHKSVFHVSDADTIELLLQNEPVEVFDQSFTTAESPFVFHRASIGQTIVEGSNQVVQFNDQLRTAPYITANALGSEFTVQEDGLYDITGSLTLGNSSSVGQITEFTSSIWINGSNTGSSLDGNSTNNASVGQNNKQGVSFRLLADLSAGDLIQIIARTDNSLNINRPLLSSGVFNYLQILKVPEIIS